MAITDELTGIYNMRYFKMLLETELLMMKSQKESSSCLILCDIDHFKEINDTHGHAMGDTVLRQVARELKSSLRAGDILARYGGDEMIVLLRNTNLKNGFKVAEKMRGNVEKLPIENDGYMHKVTISAGIASFNRGKDNNITFVKRADDALYKAKQEGRNRVCSLKS